MYVRDPNRDGNMQGRIRVQLKNDDGTPKFTEFPTRRHLFSYLCERIPKLKTRQPGYVPPAASSTAGSSGAGAGKKNKKKR